MDSVWEPCGSSGRGVRLGYRSRGVQGQGQTSRSSLAGAVNSRWYQGNVAMHERATHGMRTCTNVVPTLATCTGATMPEGGRRVCTLRKRHQAHCRVGFGLPCLGCACALWRLCRYRCFAEAVLLRSVNCVRKSLGSLSGTNSAVKRMQILMPRESRICIGLGFISEVWLI